MTQIRSTPGPARAHRARRILLITTGSVAGLLALGLGTVLVVGGIFVPAVYLQPWSPTYHERFTDPRLQIVAHAVLAPSGHNMQPWTVQLDQTDPHALDLYADPTRLSPAVDPLARQVMVSQGAFLAYAQVAAAQLGYSAAVDLFPEGDYDEADLAGSMSRLPVARITLEEDPSASTDDYASLFAADTNRAPYASAPVTAIQTSALTSLDGATTSTLSILDDPDDVAALGDFGIAGTRIETQYAAATAETDAVSHGTEQAKNEARSGFAVEGQGTTGLKKYLLQGLVTLVPAVNGDEAAAENAIASTAAGVAATAAYGLISTPGNTRTEQVEAGVLYGGFSLHAHTLGLAVQPLSQVLQEYPTMAGEYTAIHARYAPDGGTIQMLVRLGTPTVEYPVSMRRDAMALVHAP